MTAFISWYLLIILLGWLTFPLAYYLFPALADRGYTLSRAFGLLLWGFVFWLFASFGVAQNDIGGLLLGLVILGGLSAWAFINCKSEIINWYRENLRLILTTEVLFLIAFGFMAFFRAANPDITGTEKPMELMFIDGIMNSPTFPPRDLWLSGYSISYYYFGYVMTSMLAMFTGLPATIAFNFMIALIFSLSAVGAYGILYNLLASRIEGSNIKSQASNRNPLSSFLSPLFAPLSLLLVSNAEGFLEVLHSKGFFWKFNVDGSATSPFWSWLGIKELSDVPTQPLGWIPERFWWWWRASRIVQDYDLSGTWREVIDEFPFFSYLLSDLHPHVLAMPFNLMALAVALNLYFGGWRGKTDLFFGQLRINKVGFFTIALILGGLAFLNTWDILIAAALIVFSYGLARVHESGWGWERIEDILLLGIPAALTAFVMYLPFYIGFDSQAGGILPNFMYPTRGAQLWVMWGTLFIPLFAYLFYLWQGKADANWRTAFITAFSILIVLLIAMFAVGLIALWLKPELIMPVIQSQGRTVSTFIADSMLRRLKYIGSLLTLLALLIPSLAFLFSAWRSSREDVMDLEVTSHSQSSLFILLLLSLGALLILGPDFLYLRDNFGYRINTVFKFYYQAWILLSLAAAFAVAVMLSEVRGFASALYTTVIVLVIGAGLAYPVFSLPSKTDNFKADHPEQRTLNVEAYLANSMPDDYQAIQFMRQLDQGVVAEAVKDSYSEYARISTFTGMPAVLGWTNHEDQWRYHALQGSLKDDLQTLYTTSDWRTTQDIIDRYNIRYIVVGNLERTTYQVNEEKFSRFLKPVFQQGSITVYGVS